MPTCFARWRPVPPTVHMPAVLLATRYPFFSALALPLLLLACTVYLCAHVLRLCRLVYQLDWVPSSAAQVCDTDYAACRVLPVMLP